MTALTLDLRSIKLTDEQFFQLCQINELILFERNAELGWLIDLETQKVEIYRQGQEVEVLENPVTLSGEDVLPGLVMNFESIW